MRVKEETFLKIELLFLSEIKLIPFVDKTRTFRKQNPYILKTKGIY